MIPWTDMAAIRTTTAAWCFRLSQMKPNNWNRGRQTRRCTSFRQNINCFDLFWRALLSYSKSRIVSRVFIKGWLRDNARWSESWIPIGNKSGQYGLISPSFYLREIKIPCVSYYRRFKCLRHNLWDNPSITKDILWQFWNQWHRKTSVEDSQNRGKTMMIFVNLFCN